MSSDAGEKFNALSEEEKLPYRLLSAILNNSVDHGKQLLEEHDIDVDFVDEVRCHSAQQHKSHRGLRLERAKGRFVYIYQFLEEVVVYSHNTSAGQVLAL